MGRGLIFRVQWYRTKEVFERMDILGDINNELVNKITTRFENVNE